MRIRDATDDDWPRIWPFLRVVMAAGETYAWPTDITEADARDRWLLPPPWRTVVAVDDHDAVVVGTAKFGPNQDGAGRHVANASFLVDPAHAGEGIGRALGEHILEAARTSGYRAMQFNAVVESNTGAVHLWQSLGFEILATIPDAFDHPHHGPVGLHVMYRRL